MNSLDQFRAFAQSCGLIIDHVINDDRVHRVPTTGHPQKKNGAYQFNSSFGWVQNHETMIEAAKFKSEAEYQPVEQKNIDAINLIRKAELAAIRLKSSIIIKDVTSKCEKKPDHAYLIRKGFESTPADVRPDTGEMIIRIRHATNGALINLQMISESGNKRFVYGAPVKNGIFRIGRGERVILCEGYATALSIQRALKSLYCNDVSVVCCFSAGNLVDVAASLLNRVNDIYVFADNDASGTGANAAMLTNLKWAMPESVGMDANDCEQQLGVWVLAKHLRVLLRG